jgi:hypothetical protein
MKSRHQIPYLDALYKVLANMASKQKELKNKLKTTTVVEERSKLEAEKSLNSSHITYLHYLLNPIDRPELSTSVRIKSQQFILTELANLINDFVNNEDFDKVINKKFKHFIATLYIDINNPVKDNEHVENYLDRDEMIRTFGYDTVQSKLLVQHADKGIRLNLLGSFNTEKGDKYGVYLVTKDNFKPAVKCILAM